MTRRLLALAGLSVAALVVQSASASVLPAYLVPDFALLVAVAAAVSASPAEGILLAVGVGFGADLLSGSLLGHHASLRLSAWLLTRAVSAQLHLRRPLPLAAFAASLTVLDAGGTALLLWLSDRELMLGAQVARSLLLRAFVNAAFAPVVHGLLAESLDRLVEREARRRAVRLDTRRPVL